METPQTEHSENNLSSKLRSTSLSKETSDIALVKITSHQHKNLCEDVTESQLLKDQVIDASDSFADDSYAQIEHDTALSISTSTPKKKQAYNTGLPTSSIDKKSPISLDDLKFYSATSSPIDQSLSKTKNHVMGNGESRQEEQNRAKHIISEDPEILENRNKIQNAETTGNCRPWSENVYLKLFLDPEGEAAKLMVLKCEISYVDIFTDEEHSLYKSRFIGAKADGVAQLFVFDLMKSHWEEKIPQSHAIELNVDIVMSSSPINQCSESLFNILKLEKSFLKHLSFDGQLNVMIRFAHAHAWDVKDDVIRERVHGGLRNLFREGVHLEVMSADSIIEEMKVDGISASSDAKVKHYVGKRKSWKTSANPVGKKKARDKLVKSNRSQSPSREPDSSESEEDYEHVADDDMYHVFLLDSLDQILANEDPTKEK